MKEMDRRDFIKTTGVIGGAVALSSFLDGSPGILHARTKSVVAIVKSDMDLGSTCNFDMSVWGDDTAKSKQKLGLMEVSWTPESMAEIESMVRKACKLSGGLPAKAGGTLFIKPNVVQVPHLGFFLLSNYSTPRAMATISDTRVAIATAKIAREQGAKAVIMDGGNAKRAPRFFRRE